MAKELKKPSDFPVFCMKVYAASCSFMEFEDYYEYYHELLKMLWFNHDVDMPLMREQARKENPTGVTGKWIHEL